MVASLYLFQKQKGKHIKQTSKNSRILKLSPENLVSNQNI